MMNWWFDFEVGGWYEPPCECCSWDYTVESFDIYPLCVRTYGINNAFCTLEELRAEQ